MGGILHTQLMQSSVHPPVHPPPLRYYPNAMQLHKKTGGLEGGAEWEPLGDIGEGVFARLSYNSQPTFVLPLVNKTSGAAIATIHRRPPSTHSINPLRQSIHSARTTKLSARLSYHSQKKFVLPLFNATSGAPSCRTICTESI